MNNSTTLEDSCIPCDLCSGECSILIRSGEDLICADCAAARLFFDRHIGRKSIPHQETTHLLQDGSRAANDYRCYEI